MTNIIAYGIVPGVRTSTGAINPAVASKGPEKGVLDEGYLAVDSETGDTTFTFRIGEDSYQLDINQGKCTFTKNGEECAAPKPGAAGLMCFKVGNYAFTMLLPGNSNPGFLQIRDKESGRQSVYAMVEQTNSGNTAFVRRQSDSQKQAEEMVTIRLTKTSVPGQFNVQFQDEGTSSAGGGSTDFTGASTGANTDSNSTRSYSATLSLNLGSSSTSVKVPRSIAQQVARLSDQIVKNASVLSNADSTPQQKADAQKAIETLSKAITNLLQPFLQGSAESTGTGNGILSALKQAGG